MTDVARLEVAVDSKGIRIARGDLDKLGTTGGKTQRKIKMATGSMRSSFASVRRSMLAAHKARCWRLA